MSLECEGNATSGRCEAPTCGQFAFLRYQCARCSRYFCDVHARSQMAHQCTGLTEAPDTQRAPGEESVAAPPPGLMFQPCAVCHKASYDVQLYRGRRWLCLAHRFDEEAPPPSAAAGSANDAASPLTTSGAPTLAVTRHLSLAHPLNFAGEMSPAATVVVRIAVFFTSSSLLDMTMFSFVRWIAVRAPRSWSVGALVEELGKRVAVAVDGAGVTQFTATTRGCDTSPTSRVIAYAPLVAHAPSGASSGASDATGVSPQVPPPLGFAITVAADGTSVGSGILPLSHMSASPDGAGAADATAASMRFLGVWLAPRPLDDGALPSGVPSPNPSASDLCRWFNDDSASVRACFDAFRKWDMSAFLRLSRASSAAAGETALSTDSSNAVTPSVPPSDATAAAAPAGAAAADDPSVGEGHQRACCVLRPAPAPFSIESLVTWKPPKHGRANPVVCRSAAPTSSAKGTDVVTFGLVSFLHLADRTGPQAVVEAPWVPPAVVKAAASSVTHGRLLDEIMESLAVPSAAMKRTPTARGTGSDGGLAASSDDAIVLVDLSTRRPLAQVPTDVVSIKNGDVVALTRGGALPEWVHEEVAALSVGGSVPQGTQSQPGVTKERAAAAAKARRECCVS